MIVLHGFASSRVQFQFKDDAEGRAPWFGCRGIRLIVVDRPGYGDSTAPATAVARYGYGDFVDDVQRLVRHLRLVKFAVLGHSSGGGYALAIAAHDAKKRSSRRQVVGVAVVSPDPPYHEAAHLTELREELCTCQDYRDAAEQNARMHLDCDDWFLGHSFKNDGVGCEIDYSNAGAEWPFHWKELGKKVTFWGADDDPSAMSIGTPWMHKQAKGSKMATCFAPGGQFPTWFNPQVGRPMPLHLIYSALQRQTELSYSRCSEQSVEAFGCMVW